MARLLAALALMALFAVPVSAAADEIAVVSKASDGHSRQPSVSGDGRYVAFESRAGNLVPDDYNGEYDVFVTDRVKGTITRVSTAANGEEADEASEMPTISADGRYVAFASVATNLVPGDTNDVLDVFVKDLVTGAVVRANVTASGAQVDNVGDFPRISADGRHVSFTSYSPDLVPGDTNNNADGFVKNLDTGEISLVTTNSDGSQWHHPHNAIYPISADGRRVTFQNARREVFVKDMSTGALTRIATAAEQPSISADGTKVAFSSKGDVHVVDLTTGERTRVTNGDGGSRTPSVGANRVVFDSAATNLVPGDTNGQIDVFVKDLGTGALTRVSVAASGAQANSWANEAAISADGRVVAFTSDATNLVPGDANSKTDVFATH